MEEQATPYRYCVREATDRDIPGVVQLAHRFYLQTDYTDVPFCAEGAAGFWCQLMLDQGLLFVAMDGEKMVGMIGGVHSPFLMNPSYKTGAELFMWVEPEARGNGTADRLMDAIESKARELGLVKWSMMALENVHPEIAAKIYARRGYKPAERTFVKTL